MKTTRTYRTNRSVLRVTGLLWSGPKTSSEYPLHVIGQPKLEGVPPRNLAEARLIAGDFESLTSAKLVTTIYDVAETVITKKLK